MILESPTACVTAEDLFHMPSDARFELIRGELVPMSPPSGSLHGSVTNRLAWRISAFVDEHGLGECFTAETGFRLERNPDTVLAPDFSFVAKGRMPGEMPARGYMDLAPDLVVETRSPSDTPREARLKAEVWLARGAAVVWELDPVARTLTERRPGAPMRLFGLEDTLAIDDLLPGFTLPMRRLFRDADAVTPEEPNR